MKLTADVMIEARQKINNFTQQVAGSNPVFDVNQQLEILDSLFAEFEKRGQFVDEEVRVRGGLNVQKKNEAEKKDQSDAVFYARVVVARSGLRLLQQAIPLLKQISDRCLEVAGKDAVRQACTPNKIEGTNWEGKPYPQPAPEFTLPEGYETLGSKIKSAIGI